ncbi:T9SS type A sorting domain-containing protein [Flavobacterium aurantiibacter]|nr:T9SS type A sorting domain-containing protein [Flavobacterium aurantiibacter]
MKKTVLPFFLFYLGVALAQEPTITWQKSLGGTGEDSATKVIQTSDGGYLAVGATKSNDYDVTGNHLYTDEEGNQSNTWDGWVVKFNAAGEIEWKRTYGGSSYDTLKSVVQGNDSFYYVLGETTSTDGDANLSYDDSVAGAAWCLKLTPTGDVVWSKTLTASFLNLEPAWGAQDLMLNDTGDLFLAVSGYMYVNGGLSYTDGLIVRMNQNGQILSKTALGYGYHDKFEAIAPTSGGGAIAVGNTTINYFADPTMGFDYWIAKLDSNGNFLWDKIYGGSADDLATDVKQTPDGGFIVCGYTSSNDLDVTGNHFSEVQNGYLSDYWIVKLDSSGNIEWQKCYGSTGNDEAHSILIDSDGNYVVAGYSSVEDGDVSETNGTWDVWILKINQQGDILWEKNYGGGWYDLASSLVKTTDNGYIVAGETYSTDGDVSTNIPEPYANFWIVKLSADTLNSAESIKNSLQIIPNPTTEYLYIENGTETSSKATIFDLTGKKLSEIENSANQIDVRHLSNGMYILTLESKGKTQTFKFVKE